LITLFYILNWSRIMKGWKLLARSYQFLNQPEKAAWAMQQARRYAQPEASDTLRELLGPALQDRSNDE
jgi:hypothetical protein